MTAKRIYLVTVGDKQRLVEATHPANALMHIARDMASVRVPSQAELVTAVKSGVEVESVKHEQQQLPST